MTRRKEVSELDETEKRLHPDDEQRKDKWAKKRKEKSRDQSRKAQRKRKHERYTNMWKE